MNVQLEQIERLEERIDEMQTAYERLSAAIEMNLNDLESGEYFQEAIDGIRKWLAKTDPLFD